MLDEVLLRNSDTVMNGRLVMSGHIIKGLGDHIIKGLGDPVDPYDAVNKEYITARINTITDVLNNIPERINKLEKINLQHKMKQLTAPIYPELPSEDGQNYRRQKISEIEKQLISERDARKALYKKYKRRINLTDRTDTTLISTSVVMAGIGLAVLEISLEFL